MRKYLLLSFLLINYLSPLRTQAASIDHYYDYRIQADQYRKIAYEYEVKKDLQHASQFYNKAGISYFKQGFGDDYENAAQMFKKANNYSQQRKSYLAKIKLYKAQVKNRASDEYLLLTYHQLALTYACINEQKLSQIYYKKMINLAWSVAKRNLAKRNLWLAAYYFDKVADTCAIPLINNINCQKDSLQSAITAYQADILGIKAEREEIEKSKASSKDKKMYLSNYRLDINIPLRQIQYDKARLKNLPL